jgi:O-acetylserine/cysteine efflux transporter
MSPKDLVLALVVIVVWGLNFVVIKVGLHGLPPMLLGALRFVLAALPVVFIPRPQLPWRWLVAYGMTISFGQFAFMFYAMAVGMPAGLASLVLQSQAFFTAIFAAFFLGERLRASNLIGLLVAAGGLVLIACESGDRDMTLVGFVMTLCGASMWALGNVITRRVGKVNMMGLVVWGSLVPPLPFFAMSLLIDGPQGVLAALRGISLESVLVLLYLAFVATLLGYGLWSRLLSRYPASQVAPFSLLVPVLGISSSAVLLGERLGLLQMAGAVLVMLGLLINVFGARWLARLRSAAPGNA